MSAGFGTKALRHRFLGGSREERGRMCVLSRLPTVATTIRQRRRECAPPSWSECVGSSRCFVAREGSLCSATAWRKLVLCVDNGEELAPVKRGFGTLKKSVKAISEGKKKASKGLQQQKGVLLNASQKAAHEKEGSSELNKVVDVLDKRVSGQQAPRLRIDPSQAKMGKVDFVRVQTWDQEGGDVGKLENLKVKSFSPSVTSSQHTGPFYEKLVNRLQLLESKWTPEMHNKLDRHLNERTELGKFSLCFTELRPGEISVAQVQPLPRFDRWAFGANHYLQFLVDQLAVFEALKDVIAIIKGERCKYVAEKLEETIALGGAALAVSLFAEDLGLDRCETLTADLSSLTDSYAGKEGSMPSMRASTQAIGYEKYLRQLGRASLAGGEKAKEECLKLLAHIFAIYVAHLTTGMRIGAKAMDNIPVLRQTNAVAFYRDYPPLQGKDPLKVFITAINSAGSGITAEDDHEEVMEELPKAMQRTSLMLSVLAVEEQSLLARD